MGELIQIQLSNYFEHFFTSDSEPACTPLQNTQKGGKTRACPHPRRSFVEESQFYSIAACRQPTVGPCDHMKKLSEIGQVQWLTPVIQHFGRPRQADHE
ncbi:hypothetical protein AAY473_033622, partial [Plecturocebus cupreus]